MRSPNDGLTTLVNVALGIAVLGALWAAVGLFFGIAARVAYWVIQL